MENQTPVNQLPSESVNSKYEDRLLDLSYRGYLIDISPSDQWQKTSVVVAGIKSS